MSKPVLFRITNNLNVGGVQRRLRALLPLLADHYEVHVVTYKGRGIFFEELADLNIKMHFLPCNGHWSPLYIHKIAKLFKDYKAEVVHTHSFGANISGILAAAMARIPVRIAQVHSGSMHWYGKSKIRRKKQIIEETIVHRFFTHKVLFVSQESRDNFQHCTGLSDAKLQILHNGFPLPDDFTPAPRAELGGSKDRKLIGFVGRLVHCKGVEKFLDMAREASTKAPGQYHFVIIGDGPGLPQHQSWVRKQNLTHDITFLGERRDIHRYYGALDCLIFCSDPGVEGMPGVVLEAATHGLPLLVEKTAPIEEIKKYYKRMLYIDRKQSIKSLLEKTLSLPPTNTAELINEFSIMAMKNRTLELYEQLSKHNNKK